MASGHRSKLTTCAVTREEAPPPKIFQGREGRGAGGSWLAGSGAAGVETAARDAGCAVELVGKSGLGGVGPATGRADDAKGRDADGGDVDGGDADTGGATPGSCGVGGAPRRAISLS